MGKIRKNVVRKAQKEYDLWDKDQPEEQSEGVRHLLRETRKVVKTAKSNYIHSALPAVTAPQAGASYNPSVENYMDYANRIAGEEDVDHKQETWASRKMALRPGETFATWREAQKEEEQGFLTDSDEEDKPEIKEEIGDEDKPITKKKLKNAPKSMKKRRRELEIKMKELESQKTKRTKKQETELQRLKSHLKEVNEFLENHRKTVQEKRRRRILNRLTAPKTLGHGKFKEFKEPVLLPNELNGSLRGLKSTGTSILQERVKSLEKRNILPIKGEKRQATLKTTLKFKVVDKRETTEFLQNEYRKINEFNNKKPAVKKIRKRVVKHDK